MSIIVKQYTFSPGAVIIASEHNDNYDTIYSDYNGGITDSNISNLAAINNSKINLASISQNITFTGTLDLSGATLTAQTTFADLVATTADINGGTIDGVTMTGSTIAGTTGIDLGSDATGDIYYRNSSGDLTRLPKGTSGQYLQIGASIPAWANVTSAGSSFVASSTFSAQDPLSITQAVAADEVFKIVIDCVVNSSAYKPYLRFNSDSSGTNYMWATKVVANSTETTGNSTAANEIQLLDGTDVFETGTTLHIEILITSRNTDTQVTYDVSAFDLSTPQIIKSRGAGSYNAAVMSSIQILDSDANATLSGRYYVSKLTTS